MRNMRVRIIQITLESVAQFWEHFLIYNHIQIRNINFYKIIIVNAVWNWPRIFIRNK